MVLPGSISPDLFRCMQIKNLFANYYPMGHVNSMLENLEVAEIFHISGEFISMF
jgi:hypothetical protein